MNGNRKVSRNTVAEEAAINGQSATDADLPESSDAELSRMRPFSDVVGKRTGHPPKEVKKERK